MDCCILYYSTSINVTHYHESIPFTLELTTFMNDKELISYYASTLYLLKLKKMFCWSLLFISSLTHYLEIPPSVVGESSYNVEESGYVSNSSLFIYHYFILSHYEVGTHYPRVSLSSKCQ